MTEFIQIIGLFGIVKALIALWVFIPRILVTTFVIGKAMYVLYPIIFSKNAPVVSVVQAFANILMIVVLAFGVIGLIYSASCIKRDFEIFKS